MVAIHYHARLILFLGIIMKYLSASLILSISVVISSTLLAHDSGAVVDSSGRSITTGSGDCVVFGNLEANACDDRHAEMKRTKPQSTARMKKAEPAVAKVIELSGVSFKTNSEVLDSSSYQRLDKAAATLKNNPGTNVIVAGHTDSSGDAAYNQSLSEKRASMVRNYLIGKGVDGSRLSARGYGETEPVASNNSSAGRAKNRRVELRILK
jgi:OOP family OmpA-OmpF porin